MDSRAGTNIDRCEGVVLLVVVHKASESGVDAVCGEDGLGLEVDGWDVDGASELFALEDCASEFVRSSECESGVTDPAVGDEPACERG